MKGKYCDETCFFDVDETTVDTVNADVYNEISDMPEYNVSIDVDFSERGGEFAVWVCGHTHYDNAVVKEGTLCISIISDLNHQQAKLPFKRTAGTVMENAFDIYTIDYEKHKLYVTRVGAGESREFDYTPRTPKKTDRC